MTIDFSSPSQRAAGSDLTIAISPLGLVELADEEFERPFCYPRAKA